jgi:aminoglycoside phosphotransferase (APT) family kinase protein
VTRLAEGVLRWVERSVGTGARVVAVEELPPSSTEKHRIELRDAAGSAHAVVLRRYHDAARLSKDFAYVPSHEAESLRILGQTDVRAPTLIAADLAPDTCDVPAILETWIPGRSSFVPFGELDLGRFLRGAAEALVAVHRVEAPDARLPPYRRYVEDGGPAVPAWSDDPGCWERVFAIVAGEPPPGPRRFIHRDFHGGNVMWAGGEVSGVVDWATACIGPPGIDLARMRLNLAGDLGADAAGGFTRAYVRAGGLERHRDPYWDLMDACDMLTDSAAPIDAAEAASWARFEAWVAAVVAELG